MRKAVLYVSTEVLHDVLNLPDGVEIVAIEAAIDYKWGSDVAFLLSGESLPDIENGENLPMAHVTIYREHIPFTKKSELSVNGKVVQEKEYF